MRIALTCLLLASATIAGESEFISLFDGKSTDGWKSVGDGTWQVESGLLIGQSEKHHGKHSVLLTNETYSDFVLQVEFRLARGNSGIVFRSTPIVSNTSVRGYQAELDGGKRTGGLFEPAGRQWLVVPHEDTVAKHYRPRDWNTMLISASKGHILVRLNGSTVSEIKDKFGAREGHIGFQLHGGIGSVIELRKVKVKVLNLPDGIVR